jgi:hypothetical protein
MRRLTPPVIAAIVLGFLIVLIIGAMVLRGSGSEDDRLTNANMSSAREDPEKLCASQSTYNLIKREIFRRASALRGSDQPTFDKLAAYASIRMEAPMLTDDNAEIGSVSCSGTLTVDLPPGVAVVGGRRSLSAEIAYTIQPAADGSGDVVTLTNADGIITPLATLARTEQEQEPVDNAIVTSPNEVVAVEPGQAGAPGPEASAPPPSTPPRGTANPSFNCAQARSSGEVAVCNDPSLAALDQRMAAQFNSAMSDADPQQRAVLIRTRDAFLRYRDQCPSNSCIAQTYQGRMREIRDIMRGQWQPR